MRGIPAIAWRSSEGSGLALAPPFERAPVALGRPPLRSGPAHRRLLAPGLLAGAPLDAFGRFLEQGLCLRSGTAFVAQSSDDDVPRLCTAPDFDELPRAEAGATP